MQTHHLFRITALLPVVLVACSTPAPPDTRTLALIEQTLDSSIKGNQAQQTNKPPSSVNEALLPPINLNLPTQVNVEPHFDLKVDQVDARQFFMGLVDGTPYNMVVHPQVKGKITLDLKNVAVHEVMETVRSVYGFDFEKTKTAYHVYPDVMRTRIFKVDYIDVKRSGSSKISVSSGQVTQTARGGSSSSTGSGSSGASSPRDTVAASSINTNNVSNFWEDLQSTLTMLIGKDKGRNVVVSPQSGIVVVRAMPDELRSIEEYLKSTQNVMQRQVLLEAKVLEVTLSDGFQAGINWSALKDTGNSKYLLGQVGGGSVFGSGVTSLVGGTGVLDPSNLSQVGSTATSAFGGVFTAALNINKNFSAFVELLKTQGDVQVLSSPQVSTMNNQKAVIKVGSDEFFVTNVESSSNTSTGTSSSQNNVELTPFFSGVALDVIPQISEDNEIILHIHPTVVDVTEKVKTISVSSTTTLSVPLAISSIRESDTVIRAQNGQVVIIGGLMKNKKSNETASVPFLGDLPLIGALFRHNREAMTKSELVILLKPTVIEGAAQWTEGLRNTRDHLHNVVLKKQVGKETTTVVQ